MTNSQRAKLIKAVEDKYHVAVAAAQVILDEEKAAIDQVSGMLDKLKTTGGGYGQGVGYVKKALEDMPEIFTKHDISNSVGNLVSLETIAQNLVRLQKTGKIILVVAGKGRALHKYSVKKVGSEDD